MSSETKNARFKNTSRFTFLRWLSSPDGSSVLNREAFSTCCRGNGGYNVLAAYVVIGVNIVFSCFLTYKSIVIHETMQFVTLLLASRIGIPVLGFVAKQSSRCNTSCARRLSHSDFTCTNIRFVHHHVRPILPFAHGPYRLRAGIRPKSPKV